MTYFFYDDHTSALKQSYISWNKTGIGYFSFIVTFLFSSNYNAFTNDCFNNFHNIISLSYLKYFVNYIWSSVKDKENYNMDIICVEIVKKNM